MSCSHGSAFWTADNGGHMQATIHYTRGRTVGAYGDGRPQLMRTAELVARALRRRGYDVQVVEVGAVQGRLFGGER